MKHFVAGLAVAMGVMGCASPEAAHRQEESAARYEFQRIVRQYQVPWAEATNELFRGECYTNAITAYQALLKTYPTASVWRAKALRHMAHLYLGQDRKADALAMLDRVGRECPNEHWEVIQAWKEAGDLCWYAGARDVAVTYYNAIVTTYSGDTWPSMFGTLVRIARSRLAGGYP